MNESISRDPPFKSADDVAEATTISRDDYKKLTWIEAPQWFDYYLSMRVAAPWVNKGPRGQEDERHLRMCFGDDGAVQYHLVLADMERDGWNYLREAADKSGRRLSVFRIRDDVRSGITIEVVGVMLEREYLDAALQDGGVDIRVDGSNGSASCRLPPFYIEGFLRRVDAAR